MIVYLLLNTVNQKGYIGKHKGDEISTRWNGKLYGANEHLKAAKDKYGAEVFKREILNVCSSNQEMDDLERLWIITLRTYDGDYGYNMTFGGEGLQLPTKETKLKMSKLRKMEAKLMKENSDKYAAYIQKRRELSTGENNSMYGVKHKPESIRKMSISPAARNKAQKASERMHAFWATKTSEERRKITEPGRKAQHTKRNSTNQSNQ